MRETLLVRIEFESSKLSPAELTDGLNEWHHGLCQELKLVPDSETGGYVGYDWSYSYDAAEKELRHA